MEAVTDFLFLSSQITAGSDRSHEIKRHLLLGKTHDKTKQQTHYFMDRIARRSNQSVLKEINPEYSLERLVFHCLDLLTQRADSFEKTPTLGKIEGERRG